VKFFWEVIYISLLLLLFFLAKLEKFENCVNIAFILDIIINFNTAFELHLSIVRDRKKIALHYFRGWFLIDSVSCIPIFINVLASGTQFTNLIQLFKVCFFFLVF
jgi:hypothetical protein